VAPANEQTSIFQQVAAYDFGGAGLNITESDRPQQIQGVHVSADYFAMFGAPVIAGRTFTADEDSPNGGRVTVLSYGLSEEPLRRQSEYCRIVHSARWPAISVSAWAFLPRFSLAI
jgi:hypothetical protein